MHISVATLTEGAEKKLPDRSAWNCYPNWGKDKSWFRPNKYREGYNKWFSVRLSGQPRSLHKNESKAISETKCGALLPPEAASSIFSLTLCRGRIVSSWKKWVSYNRYPTQNGPPQLSCVCKQSGTIRLCPDSSTGLNAPLEDNYHPLPVAKVSLRKLTSYQTLVEPSHSKPLDIDRR